MAMDEICYKDIAAHFGITHASVRQQACRGAWDTPLRRKRKRNKLAREEARAKAALAEALAPYLEKLSAATDPREVQAASGDCARIMLSHGMRDTNGPRNAREFAIWFDIFRKTNGLDRKRGQAGAGFLQPLGALTCGSPGVKAAAVPDGPLAPLVR